MSDKRDRRANNATTPIDSTILLLEGVLNARQQLDKARTGLQGILPSLSFEISEASTARLNMLDKRLWRLAGWLEQREGEPLKHFVMAQRRLERLIDGLRTVCEHIDLFHEGRGCLENLNEAVEALDRPIAPSAGRKRQQFIPAMVALGATVDASDIPRVREARGGNDAVIAATTAVASKQNLGKLVGGRAAMLRSAQKRTLALPPAEGETSEHRSPPVCANSPEVFQGPPRKLTKGDSQGTAEKIKRDQQIERMRRKLAGTRRLFQDVKKGPPTRSSALSNLRKVTKEIELLKSEDSKATEKKLYRRLPKGVFRSISSE